MRLFDKNIETVSKVRGDSAIIPAISEQVAEEIDKSLPYYIIYGNDSSFSDEMATAMTKLVGYPPSDSYQIGAAIAANAGPEIVGVSFVIK